MTEEFYRVGDKKIPIEQVRRAGSVFVADGRRPGKSKRKRNRHPNQRPTAGDKLHKMADWWRPEGTE